MKKIFSTMAVAAALFAGYSAYSGQNSNELSDVALANVEALAQSNGDNDEITCGTKMVDVDEKSTCQSDSDNLELFVGVLCSRTSGPKHHYEKGRKGRLYSSRFDSIGKPVEPETKKCSEF